MTNEDWTYIIITAMLAMVAIIFLITERFPIPGLGSTLYFIGLAVAAGLAVVLGIINNKED